MSTQDSELIKIVKGFRVSELQTLLTYAGRNKGGKKKELQSKALHLIKLHSQPITMKIRELHMNRYQQNRRINETSDLYPLTPINEGMANTYGTASSRQSPVGSVSLSAYIPPVGNKSILRAVPNLNVIPAYAVNPDVRFKELPFYDMISEVLRPTSLVPLGNERFQERDLFFDFTPIQVLLLHGHSDIQVQLRICLLETSCEQEDELPTSVCIKVNTKLANLPPTIPINRANLEPKRQCRPIDITSVCLRTISSKNKLHISWASIDGKAFAAAVFLVRKLSAATLICRLKANSVRKRKPEHTTAMIKEKLSQDHDSEITTMSLRVSLICPLGKIKMIIPCRALTCTHLQCFDATLYVQMNEKKQKWICPVCDKSAIFQTLAIDGLFLDITSKAPSECTEVQFYEDGSWTPVMPVKKVTEVGDTTLETVPKKHFPKPKKSVEVISFESDSEPSECMEVQCHEDGPWTPVMPVKKATEVSDASLETDPKKDVPKPKKSVEVISLESDSEPSECTEVKCNDDGSWTPVMPVKKATEVSDASLETDPKKDVPKPKKSVEVISLESDSDTEDLWPLAPPTKKSCRPDGIISPVLLESPESSQPSESAVEKTFDPLAPCSSKSDPSSFKSNLVSSEKSTALPQSLLESDVSCLNPTTSPVINLPNSNYSPVSPPQTFFESSSNIPIMESTSTFHDPLELLSSTPSTSAGVSLLI